MMGRPRLRAAKTKGAIHTMLTEAIEIFENLIGTIGQLSGTASLFWRHQACCAAAGQAFAQEPLDMVRQRHQLRRMTSRRKTFDRRVTHTP